jgi:hypothetical protein
VHPAIRDLESLLEASRDLLGAAHFDCERLQAWTAEREAVFCHLKDQNPRYPGSDLSELVSLLRELLHVDERICARLIDNQRLIGEQLGAVRKLRPALYQGSSGASQLLRRVA